MAIYHFRARIISRGGRYAEHSVVAAAAYRSGQCLTLGGATRQSRTYDYTHKRGVVAVEILAPRNAPSWAADRERLWNIVEGTEKRRDAQLAREIEVALPAELAREKQIALVRGHAQEYVKLGMIVDLAIHDKSDGNPHCHMLMTTRDVTIDGFGGKHREWNNRNLVTVWRKSWEMCVNAALEREGTAERVSCESLAAQGIDRTPQIHTGPKNARDGGHERRRARNDDIKTYNAARAELRDIEARISALEAQASEISPLQSDDWVVYKLLGSTAQIQGRIIGIDNNENAITIRGSDRKSYKLPLGKGIITKIPASERIWPLGRELPRERQRERGIER
jgi:hypothetical protein